MTEINRNHVLHIAQQMNQRAGAAPLFIGIDPARAGALLMLNHNAEVLYRGTWPDSKAKIPDQHLGLRYHLCHILEAYDESAQHVRIARIALEEWHVKTWPGQNGGQLKAQFSNLRLNGLTFGMTEEIIRAHFHAWDDQEAANIFAPELIPANNAEWKKANHLHGWCKAEDSERGGKLIPGYTTVFKQRKPDCSDWDENSIAAWFIAKYGMITWLTLHGTQAPSPQQDTEGQQYPMFGNG